MSLKLAYDRNAFVDSLNAISKVVSLAENKIFWINVNADKAVSFVATDEKNFIKATPLDLAQCDDEITLCLPFVEFQTFVNNANHDMLLMVIEDNHVICGFKGEKGKYKFSRYDIPEPTIPEVESEDVVNISSIDFMEALNKTAFSVHPSKNRAPITSVKLDIYNDHFEANSTDTGRISKYNKSFVSKKDIKNISVFLPKQSIDIIKTLPCGAEVEIKSNNNIMCISSGDNFVFTGPQETNGDKFPDLNVFFKDDVFASITLQNQDIIEKLNLADALTRSEDRMKKRMTISVDGEYLVFKITGSKSAIEDVIKCDEIEIYKEDIDLKVIFPMHRLIEAIKACDEREIKISLVAPPAGINSVDMFVLIEADNWKHLILTMVDNND